MNFCHKIMEIYTFFILDFIYIYIYFYEKLQRMHILLYKEYD